MNDEEILRRPIGWWLKEADASLNSAFDSALRDQGIDRRGWQILATLARSATPRAELVASLSSFDDAETVEDVVAGLIGNGWVEDSTALLQLTPSGIDKQAELAPLVDRVRQQVGEILPDDDYRELIRLLARLVTDLPGRMA